MTDSNRSKIEKLCLFDDCFMAVCFDGANEETQLIVREFTGKKDAIVESVKTHYNISSITKRSVIFDILARDENGTRFNVEIQRADDGASPKRARYYSSMLDSTLLEKGEDYEKLPQTYVIFLTENDVFKKGRAITRIERIVIDDNESFCDGEHIIYVNGDYTDESTEIGRLIADFKQKDYTKMNNKLLSERVKHFKVGEGSEKMCSVLDEVRQEGRQEGIIESAKRLLKSGLSLDSIIDLLRLNKEQTLLIKMQ